MSIEDKDYESFYQHVLLEVYCGYKWDEDSTPKDIPEFCLRGPGHPGYHCLGNGCKFRAYTYADNEVCYAGEFGEVPSGEAYIAFGGVMEAKDYDEENNKKLTAIWQDVCRKKIDEAYDEYMKIRNEMDI